VFRIIGREKRLDLSTLTILR